MTVALESVDTAATIINTNQPMTSIRPAKEHRQAANMVSGRATLEAMQAMPKTARPIVTGKGITLLDYEVKVVTVLVGLVVALALTQVLLLSGVRGEVQVVTQIPL